MPTIMTWVFISLWGILTLLISFALLRERKLLAKKYDAELARTILEPKFISKLQKEVQDLVEASITDTTETFAKDTKQLHHLLEEATEKAIAANIQQAHAELSGIYQAQGDQLERVTRESLSMIQTEAGQISTQLKQLSTSLAGEASTYQKQVTERVQKLVDEQAAELLAQYLNASLAGVDFGDQQEFILARLEENKDKLKKEFGP